MNRIFVGLLVFFIVCYSGICFGEDKAASENHPQSVSGQTNDTKEYETKYGPFDIGKNRIVVLPTFKQEDDGREVSSVELKNEAGSSYYKASDIGVYVEGAYKLEGRSGEGLILYFETFGDAPPGGKLFQIFGIEKGKVKPLSPPISIYGELQPLPKGKSQGTLRLFDGDLIKVEVWKDFFGVVVPLVVDMQKLTIAPLRTTGIFDINFGYIPDSPWNDVKFYQDHNIHSKFTLIRYKEVKKVEFIKVYADVRFKENIFHGLDISVSNIWLKVKINGREGWVHGEDSFDALGLRPAG